jgi:hypothetical protein
MLNPLTFPELILLSCHTVKPLFSKYLTQSSKVHDEEARLFKRTAESFEAVKLLSITSSVNCFNEIVLHLVIDAKSGMLAGGFIASTLSLVPEGKPQFWQSVGSI